MISQNQQTPLANIFIFDDTTFHMDMYEDVTKYSPMSLKILFILLE